MREWIDVLKDKRVRDIVMREILSGIPSPSQLRAEVRHEFLVWLMPYTVQCEITETREHSLVADVTERLKEAGIRAYAYPNTVLRYTFCFRTAEQASLFRENFLTEPNEDGYGILSAGKPADAAEHNQDTQAETGFRP